MNNDDADRLSQLLVSALAAISAERHRLAQQATAIRSALTDLRLGRSVPVVEAHLAEAGVDLCELGTAPWR